MRKKREVVPRSGSPAPRGRDLGRGGGCHCAKGLRRCIIGAIHTENFRKSLKGCAMSDRVLKNYVDGRWISAESTRTQPVINPATGETLALSPLSNAKDVDRAVAAAHAAFLELRETPPYSRARSMFRLKALMEEHFEELSELTVLENGKIIDEARAEVRRAIENVELAAGIPSLMMGYNMKMLRRASTRSPSVSPLACAVRSTRSTSQRWCRSGSCPWQSPVAIRIS